VSQVAPTAPAAPVRRRALWPWIITGVAILGIGALLVAAVADWGARTLEMRALVNDIEASETAMVVSNDEITALLEKLGTATTVEEQRAIIEEMGEIAGVRAEILRQAGDRVAGIRIAPWHRAVERARTAYLAHNRAWQEYLLAGAADPQALFDEWPNIASTWDALKGPLRRAVPVPDPWDLRGRVDLLLKDGDPPPEEPDGGGAGAPVRVVSGLDPRSVALPG